MKKLYFLLAFLFSSLAFNAQDISIYGFLPSNNPDTDFLRLGGLDPITGNIFDEDSIYPVNAYALGSSTFDTDSKSFMFIGVDTGFNFRLYTRSLRTNTTLSDPIINQTINDLQYDMNSMNTYGLGNYISDSVLIDSINNVWMYEYATNFLQIDQDSGAIIELGQMPDISAFPLGSSTFDANDGRYIVNAYDTSFVERLVIIKAENGDVISKSPISFIGGGFFNNLEYNNEDDKIYGLFRNSSNSFTAIISVDPSSQNLVDTVFVFTDLQYFIQGSAVLHQASQNYIMFYIDNSNTSRIAVINLTSGELLANSSLSESLTEIEVDNTEYALAKYHETVSVKEGKLENVFSIYPNPLTINSPLYFKGNMVPEIAIIRDMQGRILNFFSKEELTNGFIPINGLSEGVYILSFQSNTYFETKKLIIR